MPLIVVSGALANKPFNGGEAWVRLSWLLGFERLGAEVFFLEQIQPAVCTDAAGCRVPFAESVNLAYFRDVTERFGFVGRAALVCNGQVAGCEFDDLQKLASRADLLVNISGHLTLPELFDRFRRKAMIDIDPGFTQFWHAQGNPGAHLDGHDDYFTIGENIGRHECSIPTGGIPWRPIRQPVVLDDWPVAAAGASDRFTTIASWRGAFGPVQHEGKTFGLKVHEFRKFIELPRLAGGPSPPLPEGEGACHPTFEIALDIHPADGKDQDALQRHGWRIVDPRRVVPDADTFRAYIQNSGAEFSVAQGIYVDTHSGWFSDRTVRYLASGKPALVQETGFSRNLPSGEGLVPFSTLEEAVAGAASICEDYERHAAAARRLAVEYFSSDKVLGPLLHEVDLSLK